ncbi:hypothetical protein ACIQNI_22880 [Streptomyces sp. NPDC091266]|uniref:hypothetical protein n=1 Tax=Streptomyces sp. NPDC091266 TaxID=3365978 RepID=UPI00382C8C95
MRLKFLAPALASATLLGTFLSIPAAAAGASATTVTAAASAPADCVKVIAAESGKTRNAEAVNATALGLLPKGCSALTTGKPVRARGSYDLCGFKDDSWKETTYKGITGCIPSYRTKSL